MRAGIAGFDGAVAATDVVEAKSVVDAIDVCVTVFGELAQAYKPATNPTASNERRFILKEFGKSNMRK
ncbi:hypothetical protein GCM10028807_18670 [Spirosoma daeguense]